MKIDGKVTIHRIHGGRECIEIEFTDAQSGVKFANAELSLEKFADALTGRGMVECTIDVRGLEKVGKVMHVKSIKFPLLDLAPDTDKKAAACEEAARICPEGWTPDNYFGSQDSFWQDDGILWAKCTIRCWLLPDEQPPPLDEFEEAMQVRLYMIKKTSGV